MPWKMFVVGAGIPLHDRGPAIDQLLHPLPFLRRHDGLMAALDHFPLVTGDDVIGVGADALLVGPADQMRPPYKKDSAGYGRFLVTPQA